MYSFSREDIKLKIDKKGSLKKTKKDRSLENVFLEILINMKSPFNGYNTDALIFTLLQMNRLSTHWIASSVKRICKKEFYIKRFFQSKRSK